MRAPAMCRSSRSRSARAATRCAARRRPSLTLPARARRADGLVVGARLNAEFTFATFVEGKSNQLAKAASRQVAENPGRAYNPLFLYGGVGLGKTHLMHSIAHLIKERDPEARIAYVHSERFVGDMVRALQHNSMNEFKTAYRSLDALLIDDIQFFAGKERSQEEFFHTFNELLEGQHQVILTCDRYPKEVEGLEERLKSRFGWGLTVAIEPPELETCVAILMTKAHVVGVTLPEEVAFFIAKRIRSNVRELEGALRRVIANSRFTGRSITLEFTKEALKDLLSLQAKLVTIENIQKTVADYFKVRARGPAVQAPQPLGGASAPGGDGTREGTHDAQPAGDRRCVRRARPHDGAARVQAHQGTARHRAAPEGRLFEPVAHAGRMMCARLWITCGRSWG